MKREAQSVVLVLLGATILRLSLTDALLAYVKEGMRPLLIASGVVLVVLGLVSAFRDTRGPEVSGSHDAPTVTWLLLVPVLVVFLVAPPALGSFSADRVASAIPEPASVDVPPLPDGDPVSLPVYDFAFRAVWDEGRTLDGRTVRLTGFASPADDGGWLLNRLQLSCCAADARVARVKVEGAAAPPSDAWVEVTGTWMPGGGTADAQAIPILRALDVVPVEQPRNPYE